MVTENATTVADDLLNRTAEGLMSAKYDVFASCFAFPYELGTALGESHLVSNEQNEKMFQRVLWFYRSEAVTHVTRDLVTAELLSNDTLLYVHISKAFKGPYLVQDPFWVLSIAKVISKQWKVVESRYDLTSSLKFDKAVFRRRPWLSERAN